MIELMQIAKLGFYPHYPCASKTKTEFRYEISCSSMNGWERVRRNGRQTLNQGAFENVDIFHLQVLHRHVVGNTAAAAVRSFTFSFYL